MSDIRIGMAGWVYPDWRGDFYPVGLAQREELAFASRKLRTIELNGSFYSLQRPASYLKWHAETPSDFVFSVKGSRFITHIRRLRDVETPLANFFASGVLCLAEKLGPFLWQFPETFAFDPARFETFLELLPHDTRAAAKLAERHDALVEGRSAIPKGDETPVRHAIEARSPTFATPEFVALLRRHRIALVVADTTGRGTPIEDVTADFLYLRMHGFEEAYPKGYTDGALSRWAERISAWSSGDEPADAARLTPRSARQRGGRDVFVYFDTDVKVRSPHDAMALASKLGVAAESTDDAPPPLLRAKPRKKKPSSGRKRTPK